GPGAQDRRVDIEARYIDVLVLAHWLAVEIDLDQRRRRDLFERQVVDLDEKVIGLSRHAQGHVVVDEIAPAEDGAESICRGQIDASAPFLLADRAADFASRLGSGGGGGERGLLAPPPPLSSPTL